MIEPSTSRSALDGRSPASSPAPSKGDCFSKLSCRAGEVGEADPEAIWYASEVGPVVKSGDVVLGAPLAAAEVTTDGWAVSASPAAAAMTELRISSLASPSSRPNSMSCI